MNERYKQVREQYKSLFNSVTSALFKDDPIGINFGSNTDEYDPEAGTIIPRLESCLNADEAHEVIFQEFLHWFDPEDVGPKERYRDVSLKIWNLWLEFKPTR